MQIYNQVCPVGMRVLLWLVVSAFLSGFEDKVGFILLSSYLRCFSSS